MNEGDAKAYVQRRYPTAYFYLRYFVPLRYLKQARNRTVQQQPYSRFGYWMNEYGTSPIIWDVADYDLRYEAREVDPACLEELGALALDLAARDIDFTLVVAPPNPVYTAKFPGVEATFSEVIWYAQELGIEVQNYYGDPRFDEDDYWDAFHLQWPAAQRLSREVAQRFSTSRTAERGEHELDQERRRFPAVGKDAESKLTSN